MDQRIRGHRSTRATRATTRMDSAADARHPQSPGVQSSAEAGEGAGAGIEAPVPPPAAAVPCYRRLYNSAMRALEGEMELQPYPIPEGLEGNAAVVGKGRSEQVRFFRQQGMMLQYHLLVCVTVRCAHGMCITPHSPVAPVE